MFNKVDFLYTGIGKTYKLFKHNHKNELGILIPFF